MCKISVNQSGAVLFRLGDHDPPVTSSLLEHVSLSLLLDSVLVHPTSLLST